MCGKTDILNGNWLRSCGFTKIIDHVLEKDGALDDIAIYHLSQRDR